MNCGQLNINCNTNTVFICCLCRYKANHMFSVALSIPERENQIYDINKALNGVNDSAVEEALKTGTVYNESRMIAARVKKVHGDYVHAEYRVLQNLDNLVNGQCDREHDLLLFFTLASPCYHRCANVSHPNSIINYLESIREWKHYAFVFSYVPKSKKPELAVTEDQLREALQNLGNALGLKNIYRCQKSKDGMTCRSCSNGGQVAQYCVSDTGGNPNLEV